MFLLLLEKGVFCKLNEKLKQRVFFLSFIIHAIGNLVGRVVWNVGQLRITAWHEVGQKGEAQSGLYEGIGLINIFRKIGIGR